jgi:hypothetical protein
MINELNFRFGGFENVPPPLILITLITLMLHIQIIAIIAHLLLGIFPIMILSSLINFSIPHRQ